MERRLTTILAADVVGYSRLMGVDEAGTLAALKAHRKELLEPKAHQYHGRTIKLMGDGALLEFASVVDAVCFAVEVQCAMRARNAKVPNERRIRFRIGINVGEDRDTVKAFLEQVPVEFPLPMDRDSKVTQSWPVRGLPTTFVVDADGRLVYKAAGEREWDDPALLELVRELH